MNQVFDPSPKRILALVAKILLLCLACIAIWHYPLWYCGIAYAFEIGLACMMYSGNNIPEIILIVLLAPLTFGFIALCCLFGVGFPIM